MINTSIYSFISTSAQLLWKSFKSSCWRNKYKFLLCFFFFIFFISWKKTSFFAFIILLNNFALFFFHLVIVILFNRFRYLNLVQSKGGFCFNHNILLYSIFLIKLWFLGIYSFWSIIILLDWLLLILFKVVKLHL